MAQRGRATGRQAARPARAAPSLKPVDAATVREVVEPAVAGSGYELVELGVRPVGRRYQVRLVIDGDGGLGLDVIADVSRAVSKALDDAEEAGRELLPAEYQLEVSSPGVDRPLATPAQWRRNVGRLIKVKVGDKTLTGRLTAANVQGITLEVADISHRLGFADLGPGRVQIEFNRLEEVSDEDMAEFEDDGELEDAEDEEER